MKIEFFKMKLKNALLILVLLLSSNFVNAQNTLDLIGLTSSTPATFAYSLRQLSSTYTGPLVRIRIGTSSVFYDVYPDASTKKISLNSKISASISTYNAAVSSASTTALSTIITGSTNATVAIWYDQSGNGIHVLQDNYATAFIITSGSINTMNGEPTVNFNTHSNWLRSANGFNNAAINAATINAVVQNVSSDDYISGIVSTGNSGGYGLCYNPTTTTSAGKGYYLDGSGCVNADAQAWTNAPSIVTGYKNMTTGASSIYVNSVKSNSILTCNLARSINDFVYVGSRGGNGANREFLGYISETMMFPKTLSSAEQSTLESSQSIFLPPSVTITSSASGTICAGTNVTFTATTTGVSSPTYQWTKNGVAITGATSSTYSTTSLSNNDQINAWINGGIDNSQIVSNSLLLNLDASNPASYTGSGSIWKDLSGNNNHASLINSPTYDAASSSIVTNGTTQYVNIPQINTSNSNITMQSWVYFDGSNSPGALLGSKNGFSIGKGGTAYDNNGNNVIMLLYGRGWIGTGVSFGSAGWKLVTLTLDGTSTARAYVNGALIYTYTGGAPNVPSGDLNIGAIPEDGYRYYNGKFAAAYFYNRALSLEEITKNYNAFSTKTTAYNSNTISVTISGSTPTVTVSGDGCVNKTTLTTPTGLTSYAWYKDNAVISGATSNSFTPTASGVYKVQVSNGTCTTTSTVTTITDCALGSDGRTLSINSNASSIISPEGGANFGTGANFTGKLFNTTGITTTIGTIGSSTAILGGVISPTNAISSSIGIRYSTDINFGTYSTTTIQTNVTAGTYTATISGLNSLTTYYAKSFIVNNAGTSYGSTVNFTSTAPSFVTDGLVLNLDAGNTSSYSGTGTRWTDLSGRGNHGTLINTVTYSSSNNGYLVFNGNGNTLSGNPVGYNPYVSLLKSTDLDFGADDFTVELWALTTTVNTHPDFITLNVNASTFAAFRMEYWNGSVGLLHSYNGTSHAPIATGTSSFAITLNTWQHIVVARIAGSVSVYVNGVLKTTYSLPGSLIAQEDSRIGDFRGSNGYYSFSGNIATVKIFKGKGLTSSDALTHFNLTKSRFGL